MKRGISIWRDFTLSEFEEEIKREILLESDHLIIEQLRNQNDAYFKQLRHIDQFIAEVDRLLKSDRQMTLLRAFWIINITYSHFWRSTRYSCLSVYYTSRGRRIKQLKKQVS